MLNLNHKKLDVWKLSMDLILLIYKLTSKFPKEELFGLTSQVRRATVSICLNISEGSARKTAPDRRRFYEISRSSLVEVDSQIEVALMLSYITQSDITEIEKIANELFAKLSKLIANTN